MFMRFATHQGRYSPSAMPAEPVTELIARSRGKFVRLHPSIGRVSRPLRPLAGSPVAGYTVAVLLPVAITLTMARLAWPAFIFEHLVVLLVVAMTIAWGMGPALVAAIVSVSADDLLLPFPFGTAQITGWHDGIDLVLFVTVLTTVGWLVARARRERERAERAAHEERRAREERDRLIATVSHDLATPLTAIVGTLEFARRFNGKSGIDIPRLLLRLDTAVARATALLTTLRTADSGGNGNLRVRGVPIDLRDVVSPIVHMFEQVSARHSVALTMPASPILIRGDREHLHRVVENVLSNAIKYSPDGGPIEVTLGVDGEDAVVGVRDHGIGISDQALPQIFQTRFRAPEAVTTAPGVGLGLSIAAEIVARHGGAMRAVNAHPGLLVSVRVPLMSGVDAVAVR
jgi:signal transduction histidine kinase